MTPFGPQKTQKTQHKIDKPLKPFLARSTRMPSFYSIPIPRPAQLSRDIKKLAYITTERGEDMTFYWRNETSQVLIQWGNEWYIQPNGSTTESLAALLHCSPYHIVAKNVFLFDTPGRGKAADTEMAVSFYGCEWSDYGRDSIYIQFHLLLRHHYANNLQRLIGVIRDRVRDEELYTENAIVG